MRGAPTSSLLRRPSAALPVATSLAALAALAPVYLLGLQRRAGASTRPDTLPLRGPSA